MLQASAQAVDFKVGRYFGEGQGKPPALSFSFLFGSIREADSRFRKRKVLASRRLSRSNPEWDMQIGNEKSASDELF